MALPNFIRSDAKGVYLAVKVQPRTSKNAIAGQVGDELKVCVTAPPVDAAANQALIELLADKLDCSRSLIQLTRGNTSRHKTLFLVGLKPQEVLAKLLG